MISSVQLRIKLCSSILSSLTLVRRSRTFLPYPASRAWTTASLPTHPAEHLPSTRPSRQSPTHAPTASRAAPPPSPSLPPSPSTMSHLPSSAVTLTGGCGCSCVRYTISIPPLSSRPILATDKSTNTPIRLPQFLTCHCDDCRRYTASFAPPYTVCPIDMLSLTLLPRDADADGTAVEIPASGALHPSEATRRTWLVHFQSPRKEQVHRTFCGRCGTSLFYVSV